MYFFPIFIVIFVIEKYNDSNFPHTSYLIAKSAFPLISHRENFKVGFFTNRFRHTAFLFLENDTLINR